jgi:hypothetical protein
MTRIAFFALAMMFAFVSTSSAESRMRVVRHHNYDAWKRSEARLDRAEAGTDLIRARIRRIDVDREIQEVHLQALREDLNPPGERTLGRACIYGPNDEIVYEPLGKRC